MVLSKMKLDLKKWETILSENAISLSRNKDHPNCDQKDLMLLPYGMLFTCLYRHVLTTQLIAITDAHCLVDHVMVPLTEELAHKFMVDGKRRHPQTSSGASSSQSLTLTQGEFDPVDNFTLDPVVYCDQLPPIPGGASEEFKQTKGMFKCFGHFLSNIGKKNK
ncbi:hypothetical protein Tco_0410206 [Tanacetum coccineum]